MAKALTTLGHPLYCRVYTLPSLAKIGGKLKEEFLENETQSFSYLLDMAGACMAWASTVDASSYCRICYAFSLHYSAVGMGEEMQPNTKLANTAYTHTVDAVLAHAMHLECMTNCQIL